MAKQKKERPDESILEIDITRLDEEWVNQPKQFFNWATQLADAKGNLDAERNRLDIAKAELDLDIRTNQTNYDIDKDKKLTENLILNTILQQDEYQDALGEVRNAKHRVDILQAAVQAFDHRKSALERLVSLHGQNYFSTPMAKDENSRDVINDIEKNAARGKKKKKRNRG